VHGWEVSEVAPNPQKSGIRRRKKIILINFEILEQK